MDLRSCRSVHCYEKIELRGEGTYGQVFLVVPYPHLPALSSPLPKSPSSCMHARRWHRSTVERGGGGGGGPGEWLRHERHMNLASRPPNSRETGATYGIWTSKCVHSCSGSSPRFDMPSCPAPPLRSLVCIGLHGEGQEHRGCLRSKKVDSFPPHTPSSPSPRGRHVCAVRTEKKPCALLMIF